MVHPMFIVVWCYGTGAGTGMVRGHEGVVHPEKETNFATQKVSQNSLKSLIGFSVIFFVKTIDEKRNQILLKTVHLLVALGLFYRLDRFVRFCEASCV